MEPAMNGGDGTNSYFKNSDYQRIGADRVKEAISEEIFTNLDVKSLSSGSNTIRVADLGCSTGPNTFLAMQNVLGAVERKHFSQNPNSQMPEFQVFFNDRTSNDFNTLLTSLPPERRYFPAAVPGSFHGRLFPEASLHLVYSCYALHWLSEMPEEASDENSPAWNEGRIYYLHAPRELFDACRSRFYDDVDGFLNFRATEIVGGGMMVILMGGTPDGVDPHSNLTTFSLTMDYIGSSLMEMAKEGLFSESLVDSFNMPMYYPCAKEIAGIVKKNGRFSVVKAEFLKPPISIIDVSFLFKHTRAGLEGILSHHFGSKHMDDLFARLDRKYRDNAKLLVSAATQSKAGQLFIVLKRK